MGRAEKLGTLLDWPAPYGEFHQNSVIPRALEVTQDKPCGELWKT